ncbi:MAG: tRNA (N6-threonylcarbamoyladenosine(37)-N6)-methyltransferase TrmO [Deltaproteobacteria bacterium]|nr:tRNA (N6-threonylcarbamoyladenosine(37)-N6)-methyltransferase TrmO [Deltaproteobacteria bacterium]
MKLNLKSIGTIHTPYKEWAPYQPLETGEGDFFIQVDEELSGALDDLDSFRYIYVLAYLDKVTVKNDPTKAHPPWAHGREVGLFASRSPARPNPIGLSIVKVIRVQGNRIYTSPMDMFDSTPLLDIKPYIRTLDSKEDANDGWVESEDGADHLLLHLRGIPHDHGEAGFQHGHSHEHGHDHSEEDVHEHAHKHDDR